MPSSGRALLVFMHLGECGRDTLGQPEAVQVRTPTRGQLILPPGRFRPAGGGFTSRAAAQGGDATTPGSWAADNTPSLGHRLSFLGDPLTLPPAQLPAAVTGRSLLWDDGPTCWPQAKGKGRPEGHCRAPEREQPPILFTPRVGEPRQPSGQHGLHPYSLTAPAASGPVPGGAPGAGTGNGPRGQARRQGLCRRGVPRAPPGQADPLH